MYGVGALGSMLLLAAFAVGGRGTYDKPLLSRYLTKVKNRVTMGEAMAVVCHRCQ